MDARDDAVEEELIKHMLISSTKKKKLSTCSYTKNVDCKEVMKERWKVSEVVLMLFDPLISALKIIVNKLF